MKPRRVQATVPCSAPVETVWRVLVDHEAMSTWAPGVHVSVERIGDSEPWGVGTVRAVRMARRTIRELIVAAEPRHRLAYRCIEGIPLRDYAGEVLLRPDGESTGITWVLSATGRSRALMLILGLYARVFALALKRAAERAHASSHDRPVPQPEGAAMAGTEHEPESLAAAFQRTARRDPDAVAISSVDGAVTLTWRQYADQVRSLAGGLHALGARRGDTVALMMQNRPEFYPMDTAALHIGAVPFSIYNTSSEEQIRLLLENAQPRIAVCDRLHAQKVVAAAKGSSVRHILCVDGPAEGASPLKDLPVTQQDFDFERAWRAVSLDDVATLIYTSGTTGEPKGVQLTHRNLLAEIEATNFFVRARPGDRVISFLPSAHIADRWGAHYLQLVCGTTVYPLADRTQLLSAMVIVRPTIYGAVPQIWQKLRSAVEPKVTADGATVAQLQAATIADATTFASVRAALGLDEARIVLSGAAPVPAETIDFFNALGIPLVDAWGMSELSCLAAFMPLDAPRTGSVGRALPGVEIRVAEDGELLVRGAIVMKGYLGREDLTAEVIDAAGWLHTGDIGRIDDDGYIAIVDRKKELIVTATGKNISPAAIENRVKAASALVGQVAVVGDDRAFVVALIVLDPDAARLFAEANGLPRDIAALVASDVVAEAVGAAVDAANASVSEAEQIRKFVVLPDCWEPGSDVLTHTMKLRRKSIAERYAPVVDALYNLPREQRTLHVADWASSLG